MPGHVVWGGVDGWSTELHGSGRGSDRPLHLPRTRACDENVRLLSQGNTLSRLAWLSGVCGGLVASGEAS